MTHDRDLRKEKITALTPHNLGIGGEDDDVDDNNKKYTS